MNNHYDPLVFEIPPEEEATDSGTPQHEFLVPKLSSIKGFFDRVPPKKQYLIDLLLGKDPLALLSGLGGVGKGYLALQIAISIATGLPLFNNERYAVPNPGEVIFLSLEDDRAVFHERLLACFRIATNGLPEDEVMAMRELVESRIIIPPMAGKYFPLYPDKTEMNANYLIEFTANYSNLRLIILDPANMLLAEDLSNNDMVARFAQVLRHIHSETDVPVLLLSHANKASMRDGAAGGDVTSVLGAVSLVNASRLVYTMRYPTEKYLQTHGLLGDPENYVLLRNVKGNYVPRTIGNILLKRGDGGVLEEIHPAAADPMKHTIGIVELFKANRNFGKTELLKKYAEQANISRAEAEKALTAACEKKLLFPNLGENNKKCYTLPEYADEQL